MTEHAYVARVRRDSGRVADPNRAFTDHVELVIMRPGMTVTAQSGVEVVLVRTEVDLFPPPPQESS